MTLSHNGQMVDAITPRSLETIAREIESDWSTKGKGVSPYAAPYLDAMKSMIVITDNYFQDSGVSIVLYFLANAQSWRGDTARRVKAELNAMAKDNANPYMGAS